MPSARLRPDTGDSSQRWQRALDLVIAVPMLVVCSPLLALIAVLLKVMSPGPVLYRARRVGRDGRLFHLYKFRSMYIGSDTSGPGITRAGDPRVTMVGAWLRKLKVDELPQLFNVVRGDVGLVGPRPEDPRYVDNSDPLWRRVLQVRPGLTDPVTLRLRNEEDLMAALEGDHEPFYRETLLPYKLQRYAAYLDRRTWATDLQVLLQTLVVILIPSLAPAPSLDEIRASRRRSQ